MKLYYSAGACSLAPHIALHELALPFSLVKVDTGTHKTEDGTDFYTINPKGQVPVLELDDGQRLTEGPIVAQYIADRSPGRLMPVAGSTARYRVMEWQNYVTSELHKSFTPLFNPALDGAAKKTLLDILKKKYDWVNAQLQHQPYLTGDKFTVADAYLFVVSQWAKYVSLDLSGLQHVQAFLERVQTRPAVVAALKAEGLAG